MYLKQNEGYHRGFGSSQILFVNYKHLIYLLINEIYFDQNLLSEYTRHLYNSFRILSSKMGKSTVKEVSENGSSRTVN